MQIHNFFRGSLQVDIRGAAIERFLNLCAIHGVAFWDIQVLDADHFAAWVSAGGYFALRPYARKTGCRVRVSRKKGLILWKNVFKTKKILRIPYGDTVKVLYQKTWYAKVYIKGKVGYVNKKYIK